MIKVGKDIIPETGKKLTYLNVKSERDGWVDAKKYIPPDYDLVKIKIKNKKQSHGWAVGNHWDGLVLKEGDEILSWKRLKTEM